jgi:iron complex outermembrane receptor protein
MKTSSAQRCDTPLSQRRLFKLGPVAAGCAVMLFVTASAQAQQAAPAAPAASANLSTVVITGIRKGIEDAISVKKNSDSIVEAISAEDIGKLPDSSIAESISRLPGLASQRVAGRSQTISVRGMSGDFAGTLLNGREQVSTGDNRGVEFDQYPSELLSGVLIYKTPDAALIGQGLSGTIDMQTVRPLSFPGKVVSLNLRGDMNSYGKLNADSKSTGSRFSASYIDQFADRTVGVAVGYARLDSPSQAKRWEAWGYTSDPAVPSSVKVLGGFKSYIDSIEQVRDGLMGVIQYKPSQSFESVLDLYVSKFDKKQTTRGFEVGMPWGGATLTNPVVQDGLLVGGTFSSVKPVLRNDLNKRTDDLSAIGWNNKLKVAEWTAVADLSYSKAKRNESILETYAGTAGTRDNATFTQDRDTGLPTFKTGLNYADTSVMRLNDSGGWGQDGYIKWLNVTDELKAARLSASHEMSGFFSRMNFGLHFSDRSKTKEVPEAFVDLKNSTRNPFVTAATAVPAGLLVSPTQQDHIGFGGVLSYDIQGAYDTLYKLTPNYHKDITNKNWKVDEKVNTAYAKFDIDSEIGSVTMRGNAGLQVVHTDQSSSAYAVANGDAVHGVTPFNGGTTYTDVLPSLNLAFGLGNDQTVRVGVAKVMARARVDQLRASRNYSFDANPGLAEDRRWSGDGGNPELKPFRANAFDLAYEKYFGTKAYIGAAAFYKELKTYIYEQNYVTDFAGLINPVTGVANPAGTLGKFKAPLNGTGGNISGFELSASLPFNLITPMLDGFGVIASYADTSSKIRPQGPGTTMPLPGLSKHVSGLTVYYEKNGFSARVAQRSRSEYVGEVSGFGADRELVFIKPEKAVDLQVGYEFNTGMYKGLSLLLQVNNVTNAPYARYTDTPDTPKEYNTYGRTVLFGANYKF